MAFTMFRPRRTLAIAYALFTLLTLTTAQSTFTSSPGSTATAASVAMTYKGCFSSSTGVGNAVYYMYQSTGWCQNFCFRENQAVFAVTNGSTCLCGSELPPSDTLVSDSNCNVPCLGYNQLECGGNGFYSAYLTGLDSSVANAGSDSSSGSNPSSTSTSATSTALTLSHTPAAAASPTGASSATTASPVVVTSVAPGQTVVVTLSATPSHSSGGSKSSGPNVAGIAAGVVIGVVALGALIGGIVFLLRRRQRQRTEEDFRRTQVVDFMRGGERKTPGMGWSNISDSRLDPEAGRRNSAGSIADGQDYSRRILRVANPDDS